MARVFVEHRKLIKGVALTWDLAHHLYVRYMSGSVLVVVESPVVLLAALRKQWLKVILKMRNEYARTLNAARKHELARIIHNMEALEFIVGLPDPADAHLPAIYIISPPEIDRLASEHTTIYTLCPLENRDLLKQHVAHHGALIEYKFGEED